MLPLILKGHTRPLTFITYNRDGDLLFSCAKDSQPTCWYSENGERLGTYSGHKGAVWSLSVSSGSKFLVTGGADMTVKVWLVETGELLHDFSRTGSVRHVEWAEGDEMFVTISAPFRDARARVAVYDFSPDVDNQSIAPKYEWEVESLPIEKMLTRVTWLPLNKQLLTTDELGQMRIHDVQTGRVLRNIKAHEKRIVSLCWSKEKMFLFTCSEDCSAKMWNPEDWTCLKEYTAEHPINAVGVSPIKEHVFLAGGQEADQVTTTSNKVGRFEIKIYHQVFADLFGTVSGHFGPVNALALHPEGTGFASGSEDGYIRLHVFDEDYYQYHSNLDDLEALVNA